MRTTTLNTTNVTYPDALAYAFNALPFVVELPSGDEGNVEVTIKPTESGFGSAMTTKRTTYNGKVTFDLGELVRILYDNLLRSDAIGDTLFSQDKSIELKVQQYATGTTSPTSSKMESFKLSRFVRSFDIMAEIMNSNGETLVFQETIAVMYGRGGYTGFVTSVNKLWCGTAETMQFVIGPNTQVEIGGRFGNAREVITGEGLTGYVGIVLCANFTGYGSGDAPQYINVVKAPSFQPTGKLYETTRKFTFHSDVQVASNDGYARVNFLSPQCEIITEVLKPLSQVAVSEIASNETTAIAYEDVDFGANRKGVLNKRKKVTYNVGYRAKYSSLLLPNSEVKRLRDIIGAAFVELTDHSVSTATSFRVYPVPASVEIKPSQSLTSTTIEFEFPTLNPVGV